MKFNKCTLALCVSTAILSGALHANAQTESVSAYGSAQQQERATYTLYLTNAAAIERQGDKRDYTQRLAEVSKLQDQVFNQIKAIDPQAILTARSGLVANIINVELQSGSVAQVKALDAVQRIFSASNTSSVKQTEATQSVQQNATVMADEEVALLTPYTGNESAGAGVSVAIISTGIDYTLPIFGGSGVYGENNDPETPPPAGSYLEALENGAIEYSGFPTAVVAGGWDFSSENYGNDANPIDQNLSYVDWSGWEYPTGMGTELASIVHQLAPGASLHAYKVYNVSGASWDPTYISASGPSLDKLVQAFEHALDPNQDGDISDRIDIALLEASGAGAFFDIDGNASVSLLQLMIERVSAQGMTVVTHAGDLAEYSLYGDAEAKHRNWISAEGSATSAITVGAVNYADDGETLVVPEWAAMGPVRGSQTLKPEIVTFTDNQPVVHISNADETAAKYGMRSGSMAGAARIAAAAAVIKSQFPGFGPAEIKAVLANTANIDSILESDEITPAEIYSIGHGVEDLDAAISSPLVAWESASNQPYVQFGMHEIADTKTVHKNITVRNVSDTAQTYSLSFKMVGDKAAHEALTLNLPESVNIPANSSVVIPVSMIVDANKLPQWPLMSTADHTDANLKATELNGYISLMSEGKPELNLGWMVKARHSTSITKRPNATEFPSYLGWNPDTFQTEWNHLAWGRELYPDDEFGNGSYQGYVASFINDSKTETTFQAYPLILQNRTVRPDLENVKGHKIKAVGGAIFDDAMCTVSGKKLNIAVSLFDRADVALANFQERGPQLFAYDLFFESVVLENGWNESFSDGYIWDEAQQVNQPRIALNAKGQPATYVIDYSVAYDYTNPNGRMKESTLPTYFTNNGKNIVSQVCLEDLYHHELDSVEDFDQNFGFHIQTDRHTGKEQYEPIAQFNPIKGGNYAVEESCYFDWFTGMDVCTDVANDRSVHVGFAAMGQDAEVGELAFSPTYTAQPGEEVYIASVGASDLGGIGQIPAPKDFMVVSVNDDFMQIGYNAMVDDDGSIVAKAQANQVFSVAEGAEMNTVLGKIELDTQGFFTYGSTDFEPLELHIVNSVTGTPFAIDQETHELYVVNPSALDFENNQEFELKILAQKGNTVGETESIKVMVTDVNDIAPVVDEDVAAAMPTPQLTFKKGDSASFTMDIDGLFMDVEGNSLSYTVEGSGFTALAIAGTQITGELDSEGSHQLTVTASDGVNEVSHTLTVESTYEKDSGGSLGMLSLLFAGLIALRRRF
ncbi:S8 family serine peptidase [Shewanella sp. 4_MG-2023]|uniref:S8 family serine peptidase n=1 Tax=Shewanella sp. 4_MG-2023 TaxID=3062652 RepID=UPI0026E1619B|nr:S8 family serine peptidase [Shewanella sp. 4_MG-2023]MDO6678324.1 S8 family serine peptidase [Shewanella sp. 4_MG-2023]